MSHLRNPIAAIVVGYMPDVDVLDRLLQVLVQDGVEVFLVDNGGAEHYLQGISARNAIKYIDMQGNAGLGAALNRGMVEARKSGYRYVATFDQDSTPPSGMLNSLFATLCTLTEAGVPCAAVGPRFYDRRAQGRECFPLYQEQDGRIVAHRGRPAEATQQVDVLITSGMLLDSNVWASGLNYNPDLIVDYTDTEWCFRVRAAGYKLFVAANTFMPHALSDSPPVRLAMGVSLLRYTPLRRYYYFRNTVYFVRRPYVSSAWKKRLMAGLVVRLVGNTVVDRYRFRGLKLSFLGLVHGLQGKLGQYRA